MGGWPGWVCAARDNAPSRVAGDGDGSAVSVCGTSMSVARVVGEGHVGNPAGVAARVIGDVAGRESVGDSCCAAGRASDGRGQEAVGPVVAVLRGGGDRRDCPRRGVGVDVPGAVAGCSGGSVGAAAAGGCKLVGQVVPWDLRIDQPASTVVTVCRCVRLGALDDLLLHDAAGDRSGDRVRDRG